MPLFIGLLSVAPGPARGRLSVADLIDADSARLRRRAAAEAAGPAGDLRGAHRRAYRYKRKRGCRPNAENGVRQEFFYQRGLLNREAS